MNTYIYIWRYITYYYNRLYIHVPYIVSHYTTNLYISRWTPTGVSRTCDKRCWPGWHSARMQRGQRDWGMTRGPQPYLLRQWAWMQSGIARKNEKNMLMVEIPIFFPSFGGDFLMVHIQYFSAHFPGLIPWILLSHFAAEVVTSPACHRSPRRDDFVGKAVSKALKVREIREHGETDQKPMEKSSFLIGKSIP